MLCQIELVIPIAGWWCRLLWSDLITCDDTDWWLMLTVWGWYRLMNDDARNFVSEKGLAKSFACHAKNFACYAKMCFSQTRLWKHQKTILTTVLWSFDKNIHLLVCQYFELNVLILHSLKCCLLQGCCWSFGCVGICLGLRKTVLGIADCLGLMLTVWEWYRLMMQEILYWKNAVQKISHAMQKISHALQKCIFLKQDYENTIKLS